MNIVKLNKRHDLYHRGFTYGISFKFTWDPVAHRVRTQLYNMYGSKGFEWETFTDRSKYTHWIGVRDESVITMILLSMPNNS